MYFTHIGLQFNNKEHHWFQPLRSTRILENMLIFLFTITLKNCFLRNKTSNVKKKKSIPTLILYINNVELTAPFPHSKGGKNHALHRTKSSYKNVKNLECFHSTFRHLIAIRHLNKVETSNISIYKQNKSNI